MAQDRQRKSLNFGNVPVGVFAVLMGVASFAMVSFVWILFVGPIIIILALDPTESLGNAIVFGIVTFGPMFAFIGLAWLVAAGVSGRLAAHLAAVVSFGLLTAFIVWGALTADHV